MVFWLNTGPELLISAIGKLHNTIRKLDFPILQGSINSLDEPNSILITQKFAEKLFPKLSIQSH